MCRKTTDDCSKKSYRVDLGDIARWLFLGGALWFFILAYDLGPAERSSAFLAAGIGFGFWGLWGVLYWIDVLDMRGWNHA